MISLFSLFARSQRRKELAAKKQTRDYLLSLSDRLLEDAGFSRPLLEQGLNAWPWRTKEFQQSFGEPAIPSKKEIDTAVSTLRSFSDKDLRDLGIGRGEISYVVEHGRQGFDCDQKSAA